MPSTKALPARPDCVQGPANDVQTGARTLRNPGRSWRRSPCRQRTSYGDSRRALFLHRFPGRTRANFDRDTGRQHRDPVEKRWVVGALEPDFCPCEGFVKFLVRIHKHHLKSEIHMPESKPI